MAEVVNMKKLVESLSPNERKIVPHLEDGNMIELSETAELDKTRTLRYLQLLSNFVIFGISRKSKDKLRIVIICI